MKAENILALASELRLALDPDGIHKRPETLDKLKEINKVIPGNPITLVSMIIAECEEEIQQARLKKGGRTKAFKTAKKIIKSARDSFPARKEWHYPQEQDGFQYFTSGIIVMKIKEPFPFENAPADVIGPRDLASKYYQYTEQCTQEILDIPNTADIAAFIKKSKSESTEKQPLIDWRFNCGLLVNAEHLLDAMETLNTSALWAYTDADHTRLYLKTGDEGALVFGRRRIDRRISPAQ